MEREMSTPEAPSVHHDLSTPGDRPLCGAEEANASGTRDPDRPVTCAACQRLRADDARRAVHRAQPERSESED
jgi:hypothetical protein